MDYIADDLQEHAVEVGSVSLDSANTRKHPDKNKDAVKSSLREFGQRQVLVARQSDRVIEAGNLRLTCARELGWDYVAVIFVDDDKLQAARYAIADNRSSDLGEWDDDNLGAVLSQIDDPVPGFTDDDVDELLDELNGEDDEKYTKKIETPTYEPTGPQPDLSDLHDTTKHDELVEQINNADIPEDVAEFLRDAATRHMKFEFDQVAEYYAHAPPEVQRLFEQSALVIIDVDQAIEGGFVHMTDEILSTLDKGASDDDS